MEIHLDFETRSRLDLKKCGAYRYAEHTSTDVVCMRWRYSDGIKGTWSPFLDPTPPKELCDAVANGAVVVAHNAQFEYCIWNKVCVPRYGFPPLPFRQMQCTMAAAGYRAYPLALEKACKVGDVPVQKDMQGRKSMLKLAAPDKKTGEFLDPRENIELLLETIDYCGIDVAAEEGLDQHLGRLPAPEQEVFRLDQKINERGVQIDLDAVHAAKDVVAQVEEKLIPEFRHLTKLDTPNQVAKIVEWCGARGVEMDNLQAGTVDEKLGDSTLPDDVRRVLEIRKTLGLASIKKLDAMLACVCDDGRMRGLLQYHAASTGRWAGRLAQPHNYVRGVYGADPEDIIALLAARDGELLAMVYGDAIQAVSDALRPMMVAGPDQELVAVDYSAIEAVVLACLAGEQWKIDAFAAIARGEKYNGADDIYCATAGKMFGRPVTKKGDPEGRQAGKVCELAFGFEGGVGAWRGFDSSDRYTDAEVDEFKNSWREQHPMTKAFWRGLNDASVRAVLLGKPTAYRGIEYKLEPCGRLSCRLLSGRKLWYNWPKIEWEFAPWQDPETDEPRPVLKYWAFRMGQWRKMDAYGGLDTENVVQATARDILVHGMFSCEAAGYPLVLDIHDELIAEVPLGTGCPVTMAATASELPRWAQGWPVVAPRGWVGHRYRKD